MEETGISVVESNLPEKKWYHNVSLEDADTYILANMKSAVRSVIAIGYYLKCIRDDELYLEAGYTSIWDYAKDKYGFSKSTATRYMKRNDKFSVDGNSPILAEEYREFGKSQLQEMLSLDDEQLEQVTPDMTVKQIREMRKPAAKEIPYFEIPGQLSITDFPGITEEEVEKAADTTVPVSSAVEKLSGSSFTITPEDFFPEEVPAPEQITEQIVATSQREDGSMEAVIPALLSAYGTTKREYPPDSLIATEGCEGGHDCFSCAMECQIRGAGRYCREAPMGNPFPCEQMIWGLQAIRDEVGDKCQFINHELAEHYAGTGEPDPCCKSCENPCKYLCVRAMKDSEKPEKMDQGQIQVEPEPNEHDPETEETTAVKDYDRDILEKLIREESEALQVMAEYWRQNQPRTYTKYRMKLDAYQLLMEHHDQLEKERYIDEG